MLIIRLSRTGRKNQPYYRILVQEKKRDTQGKYVEIVGNYNTHTDPPTVVLKEDRIKYWLSKGAQTSATLHNILVNAKIITAPKRKVVSTKPEPKKPEEKKPVAEAPKPAEKKEEPKKEEPKKETPKPEEKKEEPKKEEKK